MTDISIGSRFGKLVVTGESFLRDASEAGRPKSRVYPCVCDCGRETFVVRSNLLHGATTSCGCRRREACLERTTHGMTKTRLYEIWKGMRRRCEDESTKDYARYGGRGVSVCGEWATSFEAFRDWAMSHGYAEGEGLSIDRIDNDGPYEPSNCRWATTSEQARNRRSNRRLIYRGETRLLVEWAEATGIPSHIIRARLSMGWSVERALGTPYSPRVKAAA